MKYVLILISTLFLMGTVFGQEPIDRPINERLAKKIEAQKIAFITKILDLTPEEAQQFWPLYNEYIAKDKELKPNFKRQRPESMSEEEANDLIIDFFDNEQKKLTLKKNYYDKFKMVLPATKVVKLHFAERKFKEELLKRIKKRRDKRKRR